LSKGDARRVGLFVTCLADLMRPSVAFAAVRLLEDAGCTVEVPVAQTCCGQPALNSGDRMDAREIAKRVIVAFEGFDAVVGPSGSCMGTLRQDYPALFADDPAWAARAESLAGRSHELLSFLVDVLKVEGVQARYDGRVTYHDSCAGLREMGVKGQPRQLLASVQGLDLVEMRGTEECCGFGGTFCVKYPEISTKMVEDKIAHIQASGAGTVLGGDLGCLLNIAGRIKRRSLPIRVLHTAEVLAGMGAQPAIGEPASPPGRPQATTPPREAGADAASVANAGR
jgi:L-lactate dehydrogenase complex protein LldE